MTTDKFFFKNECYRQAVKQIRYNINKHVNVFIARKRVRFLNDENKLQQNLKIFLKKSLNTTIRNFKTFSYTLLALKKLILT